MSEALAQGSYQWCRPAGTVLNVVPVLVPVLIVNSAKMLSTYHSVTMGGDGDQEPVPSLKKGGGSSAFTSFTSSPLSLLSLTIS